MMIKNYFMKKILFVLLIAVSGNFFSQQTIVDEPEFVGECLLIKDNQATLLEKNLTQNRTVASTGLILTGIGKVRQQVQIDGCCASVKISNSDDVRFIIRNIDNQSDPLSIIKILKFEVKKNYRRAELASFSTLGSAKSNNLDYVSFVGKKYGTSSYILKLENLTVGEYGITIMNPNSLDQKQTVISTFSVTN